MKENKKIIPLLKFCCACFIIITSLVALSSYKVYAQDGTDFKFKLGITYNISSGDNDKQHKLAMWFSDGDYSGMEPTESKSAVFIVFDMKNMKMLTIMEAQKMVMSIDLAKFQQQYQQKQGADENKAAPKATITKTGVTEKILGYNCDQYKITSEKNESLIWVTSELGSGFGNFSKSIMMALNSGRGQGGSNTSLPDTQGAANGVMLKMVATDLSNNKVTTLEATEVNKDGKELNTTGYRVMAMPGQ